MLEWKPRVMAPQERSPAPALGFHLSPVLPGAPWRSRCLWILALLAQTITILTASVKLRVEKMGLVDEFLSSLENTGWGNLLFKKTYFLKKTVATKKLQIG